MSDVTRGQRAAKGHCVDCGAKIEAAAYRCRDCAVAHAGEMRRSRCEKGTAGICPACGKNRLEYGLKRCFVCVFGIREADVEDLVDLLIRHPRAWDKMVARR
jgi:hypothetical protein